MHLTLMRRALAVRSQTGDAAPKSCKLPVEEPELSLGRRQCFVLTLSGPSPARFDLLVHGPCDLPKGKAPPYAAGLQMDTDGVSGLGGPVAASIRCINGSNQIQFRCLGKRAHTFRVL